MNEVSSIYTKNQIKEAARTGQLYFDLGPFRHKAVGDGRAFVDHFWTYYRHTKLEISADPKLAHHRVTIRAPSWVRKFIRPQVVADPGFESPTVPLPRHMSALAFEMATNLSVALTTYQYLILHAGVVADAHLNAVLISAVSGGGKSTLAAYLMAKGGRLYSDEFALIKGKEASFTPYPRPISLKNESIELVGTFWPKVGDTLIGTPKGRIAYAGVRSVDQNNITPALPSLILFPQFSKNAALSIKKLEPEQVVLNLINSSPNYAISGAEGFKAIARLAYHVPAYQVGYGDCMQLNSLIQDHLDLGLY